jgi:Domain of unknown function (DUF4268)
VYTKDEKKDLVKKFWEAFSLYSSRLSFRSERRKHWMLHHTKVSCVHLKFDPDRNGVRVILEINHRDEEKRLQQYEKIEMYRIILEEGFDDGLIWNFAHQNETGQDICHIYTGLTGVDIHRISDWERMFQFMAENMFRLENNFIEIRDLIKI